MLNYYSWWVGGWWVGGGSEKNESNAILNSKLKLELVEVGVELGKIRVWHSQLSSFDLKVCLNLTKRFLKLLFTFPNLCQSLFDILIVRKDFKEGFNFEHHLYHIELG